MSRRSRFNVHVCIFAVVATLLAGALSRADREAAKAAYREGNTLFDQGRFADAIAAYVRAIEQEPDLAEAYHNRALASEMVDRPRAIEDWRRFVELGANHPELKFDVARVEARLQMLQSMPALPDSMHPRRYVPEAGDYYWEISLTSEGEEWRQFPLKVFLGSAPEMKWQEGTREAYNIWSAIFPFQLVARPEQADIRLGWEEAVRGGGHAGEEHEWVEVRRVGDQLTGRRVAVIVVNLGRNWSKVEMRAIVLHEMGHALGFKGHSDSTKDIMYWQMQNKVTQIPVPIIKIPLFWRTLVKQPSQRDINTLVRLYNSAGSGKRFP